MRSRRLLAATGAVLAGLGITSMTACGTTAGTRTVYVSVTQTATAKPAPTVTKPVTAKPAPTVTKSATTAPAVSAPAPVRVPQRPATPQYTNALSVVDQFYQDITDHNYPAAWSLGGENLSGGVGYDAWVAGYATTVSITLYDAANFGSGEVTAYLSALQGDGSTRTYSGTYYVANGVITGANIAKTS